MSQTPNETELELLLRRYEDEMYPLFAHHEKLDVHSRDLDGDTLLDLAAVQNDIEAVRTLVAGGIDIDATGFSGRTPLHVAVRNGNLAIVELLLDRGARIDTSYFGNSTPISDATRLGHEEILQRLLAKQASATPQGER